MQGTERRRLEKLQIPTPRPTPSLTCALLNERGSSLLTEAAADSGVELQKRGQMTVSKMTGQHPLTQEMKPPDPQLTGLQHPIQSPDFPMEHQEKEDQSAKEPCQFCQARARLLPACHAKALGILSEKTLQTLGLGREVWLEERVCERELVEPGLDKHLGEHAGRAGREGEFSEGVYGENRSEGEHNLRRGLERRELPFKSRKCKTRFFRHTDTPLSVSSPEIAL